MTGLADAMSKVKDKSDRLKAVKALRKRVRTLYVKEEMSAAEFCRKYLFDPTVLSRRLSWKINSPWDYIKELDECLKDAGV